MGEMLILKKYQELPPADQALVVGFIQLLLKKKDKRKTSDPKPKKRMLGTLKGQIQMAADFNEPLDDLKEYM